MRFQSNQLIVYSMLFAVFLGMSIQASQPFQRVKARKNVIIGGAVILVCITLLSCVSSFMIYREGFNDLPGVFQNALAFVAVVVVEGAFVWLVYGFTRAFSSFWERAISFTAMWGVAAVMLINIITHFMLVKGIGLFPFQQAWLAWGAVSVFIGVLVVVLSITLADPVIRLIRLELRYLGRQEEKILEAKNEGLESEKIQRAMAERAEIEADQLSARIIGQAAALPPSSPPVRGFGQNSQRTTPPVQQQEMVLIEYKSGHEEYVALPLNAQALADFYEDLKNNGAKIVAHPKA